MAGRGRREIEGLVGFFVNNLVLRADLSGDPTFRELLGRVRGLVLDAFSHQETPFEKVVDAVAPERELGRNPLHRPMIGPELLTELTDQTHSVSLLSIGVPTRRRPPR